ncbi:hypothetical protein PF002_g31049 [Phytophthora fragariae]|uniref:Uncharacterized protein n=1 Tax=Phytophthora fragariae TaxID=53985 RepID=A0A6A3VJ66_9STRA|nr:hypothetical protein PF002_g31049 [Phytophthora fragariae]
MRNWKNLGETAAVDWFRKQYLSPKWKLWYYPASKSPGVTPNQNPIESHNRDIKRVVDTQLYASTKIVLNSSLPRIIAHFGTARDRNWNVRIPEPIRPYAEAPVPIECALKASILTRGGNFWKVKNGRGKVTGILFNSSTVMIGGKSSNPSPIDEVRAKRYLQSRKGHLQATDDVEHIEKNYLSLYLVQQLSDESFEHNWSSPKWTEPENSSQAILRLQSFLRKWMALCSCTCFA